MYYIINHGRLNRISENTVIQQNRTSNDRSTSVKVHSEVAGIPAIVVIFEILSASRL